MNAEDILSSFSRKQSEITVDGVPGPITIEELSTGVRLQLTDVENVGEKLALIVRHGTPALNDIEEAELLDRIPFDALIAISDAVMAISGLKDDEPKKSD